MNGRHDDVILPHRDDDDDDDNSVNMDTNGHQEMPRRSDSPILRPLPSMCIIHNNWLTIICNYTVKPVILHVSMLFSMPAAAYDE